MDKKKSNFLVTNVKYEGYDFCMEFAFWYWYLFLGDNKYLYPPRIACSAIEHQWPNGDQMYTHFVTNQLMASHYF
jgi:hypothetical protein